MSLAEAPVEQESRATQIRAAASVVALLVLGASIALWLAPPQFLLPGLGLASVLVIWGATTPAWRAAPVPWWIALGGLLVTACMALYPSVDLDMSLPQLYGIVLGIGTCGVLCCWLTSERRLGLAGILLVVALSAGLAAAALVTNWPSGGKGLSLDAIYQRLPTLPSQFAYPDDRRVNPNKLAAPLAMLVPLLLAGYLAAARLSSRLVWGTLTGAMAFMLFLTQSRSAYLAGTGSLLVLLMLHSRRCLVLLVPLIALVVWVTVWAFGPQQLVRTWPVPPLITGGATTLEDGRQAAAGTLGIRRGVWEQAGTMVADFPLTGIGLGTFPRVSQILYGPAPVDLENLELPHTHNLALQVAVDLGLPGLGFFTLLTVCLIATARRAIVAAPSRQVRGLAAGASCGLLAYYLFGLTDVVGLGEKPGMLFWVLLGIVAACARYARVRRDGPTLMLRAD